MPGEVESQTIEKIHGSSKYRSLTRETIADILEREIRRHGPGARALKAARLVLHRVGAFYLGVPDYAAMRAALEACGDAASRAAVCRDLLGRHISTRERLPILDRMYRELFARTGPPVSVADLAAACNPFCFPWMGLPTTVRYDAYDINADMVGLVARYFEIEGIAGRAIHRDVLCRPPVERYDVALLLKMYHCLEHRRRGAGWEMVSAVNARTVAVSFPTRNMSGRVADIAGNYLQEILERSAAAGWGCEELAWEGERVVLVRKAAG